MRGRAMHALAMHQTNKEMDRQETLPKQAIKAASTHLKYQLLQADVGCELHRRQRVRQEAKRCTLRTHPRVGPGSAARAAHKCQTLRARIHARTQVRNGSPTTTILAHYA